MPEKQKHSPGPWKVSSRHTVGMITREYALGDSTPCYPILGPTEPGEAYWKALRAVFFAPEDARRAERCVTACAGLNPEAVPELVAALETLSGLDDDVCHRCEGEGNMYADGKAHYMSEHAPTIACPTCGGEGRRLSMSAEEVRDLATAALAKVTGKKEDKA